MVVVVRGALSVRTRKSSPHFTSPNKKVQYPYTTQLVQRCQLSATSPSNTTTPAAATTAIIRIFPRIPFKQYSRRNAKAIGTQKPDGRTTHCRKAKASRQPTRQSWIRSWRHSGSGRLCKSKVGNKCSVWAESSNQDCLQEKGARRVRPLLPTLPLPQFVHTLRCKQLSLLCPHSQ